MARAKTTAQATTLPHVIRGRTVATLGRGLALVKVGKAAKPVVNPEDETTALVKKAARALSKPGLDKAVVFHGPNAAKVFSYSAYPADPSKVVREASDGTRVLGRVVDGKFRIVKP